MFVKVRKRVVTATEASLRAMGISEADGEAGLCAPGTMAAMPQSMPPDIGRIWTGVSAR